MRSRIVSAALALVTGLLLVPAGSASADPAHCSGWNTHPDRYSAGGITFKDGAAIRRGPFGDCDRLGLGYRSHGVDVHCFGRQVSNPGPAWIYVRDTSTGVSGWVRSDALNYQFEVAGPIPRC